MDFLFENLNEAQKKAVAHKDGPLLVIAGAGAGKTRAISHRVAKMISEGVSPESILAITFTNKAAKEMKERIHALLTKLDLETEFPSSPRSSVSKSNSNTLPFISTFHALGVHILRKSGRPLNIPRNFAIFDKEDSLSVIKGVIKDLELDPKQFQPGKIQSIISKYKGDLMDSETFGASVQNEYFPKILSRIWDKYEKSLIEQKALDFGDLITKTVFLLQKDSATREYYQNLWKFIHIDEYQDTNKAQYKLSKILAEKHKNICIIGDMDQSIYGWRGADFRNITNFERDYPEHELVTFAENYRSTKNILDTAANIIEKNKMRKPKDLIAQKEAGAEISLFEAMNEIQEADFIAKKAKEAIQNGENPEEIAVLYRANFQSRVMEESCLKNGVPYNVLGTQFYQRKEVKDIFAYLRAAINPESLIDIKRIINVPTRGIGKVTIVNCFSGKKLPDSTQQKVDDFFKLLERIREKIETTQASSVIKFVMRETGYQEMLEAGGKDDEERLENLKELASIASTYDYENEELGGQTPKCIQGSDPQAPIFGEGVEKMLEEAALRSDQDNVDRKQKAIRLMTCHSAKGLEFNTVFIAGLEDGLFPHRGFGDWSAERNEEERRLFYVAVTRAKEKLYLSFSDSRTVFGSRQINTPSKFISDIPTHLLKIEPHQPTEEKVIEYL
jgi:DNA helicase-2/ATP-dependent DNA helicase PcrA